MDVDPSPKRAKCAKVVGTHSGSFHCDEALACFMLTRHVAEFKDATVVRSRDKEVHAKCDIVVDVGGEFDVATKRFDHHQKGFTETFSADFSTKLSSAGLVYKYYGREIIRSILAPDELDESTLDLFYNKVYERLIEGVDGIDNGVCQFDTEGLEPKYHIGTDLSSRVKHLNPWWNVKRPEKFETDNDHMDYLFSKAMEMTGEALEQKVLVIGRAWWPARSIVANSYKRRFTVDSSGQILLLDQFCPWKEHLSDLETEAQAALKEGEPVSNVLYVLYADQSGKWRVQGVPESQGSFICRKYLPQPWRGLRDDELDKVTGVKKCVFVHASGFIGGHMTREGALQLARMAISFEE